MFMGWLLEAPLEAEIRGLVLGRADKETKAGSLLSLGCHSMSLGQHNESRNTHKIGSTKGGERKRMGVACIRLYTRLGAWLICW